jgi:DNA polymerase III epsilon subunit-like protein
MPKLCFIYTDTNGLHKCNQNPSSKNLYKYARLIAIHYMIGTYSDNIFTFDFTKHIIIKPQAINFDETAQKIHKITFEEAMEKGIDKISAMTELKKDLSGVNIIVSHNLPFHIKALQVECFRTAIDINFSKFINIDLMSFGHNFDYPKLVDLLTKYKIKGATQLDQYKELFFTLYKEYKKTISTVIKQKVEDECDFID